MLRDRSPSFLVQRYLPEVLLRITSQGSLFINRTTIDTVPGMEDSICSCGSGEDMTFKNVLLTVRQGFHNPVYRLLINNITTTTIISSPFLLILLLLPLLFLPSSLPQHHVQRLTTNIKDNNHRRRDLRALYRSRPLTSPTRTTRDNNIRIFPHSSRIRRRHPAFLKLHTRVVLVGTPR